MNGFAHQPPTPPKGDDRMKKAPDVWSAAEWDNAQVVFQGSKVFDPEVITSQRQRFVMSAQNNSRRDVKKWGDFSKGEQAALEELLRREKEEEASYEVIPPSPTQRYFDELKGSTLEHGLHPEDDKETRKIIDSM